MTESHSSLFTPFTLTHSASLSPLWLNWLGAVLNAEAAAPAQPPAADWQEALPALDRHGILPLIHGRLRSSLAWNNLTPATRTALAEAYYTNAARGYLLGEELARIVSALAGQGIATLLLKGLAAAQMIYSGLAERVVNDFDLLVRVTDVDASLAVLSGMGYRAVGLSWLSRWQRRYRSEIPLVCAQPPCTGLLVELHWSLVESPYHVDRVSTQDIWQRAQSSTQVAGAWLPDPATLLVHGAAHLALHHSRELRLIWLVDLDRLARHPALDWDEVLHMAEAWRLGLALQAGMQAASNWLATPVPAPVWTRLETLAHDPVAVATWGVGDEQPGRWWRRARVTWSVLGPAERWRYAAWLSLRAVARPFEAWEQRKNVRT